MTTLRTRPSLMLVALGAAALLISGCGGGGSDSVTGVTTTPGADGGTTAAGPTPTTTDGGTAAGDETGPAAGSPAADGTTPAEPAPTGTDPVTDTSPMTAPAAVLANVRWSDRGTYDRLVLDFTGPFGGYQVQYVDSLTEDPTGDPVELAGGAVLAVSIQGATRNNAFQTSDTTPLKTYGGPARVAPNLPNLKEVADAGDFEAVLSFGIGLDHEAGFKVMHLTGPERLVVDVAH
jgi:hypothetical protein